MIAVRRGWVTLEVIHPVEVVYPKWKASNGWIICVFDDVGSWDYIEWIETTDGRRSEYDDIYPDYQDDLEKLGSNPVPGVEPDGEEIERIWHWHEATTPE